MNKIIIAGGRKFNKYELMRMKLMVILKYVDKDSIQIVSGGAAGADLLGERYAKEHKYIVKRFEARWDLHGKAAGPIRNQEMAEYATHLIAFWDGKSKGTADMIKRATDKGLKIRVIKYA